MKKIFLVIILFSISLMLKSQDYPMLKITTGVPFLTIVPDARGGAMGDIGAGTTADITSIFYNPSKYIFAEDNAGLIISYSPWLRKIASDMGINYLAGYYKINDNQVFSASLKYFTIGEIQFTNEFGDNLIAYSPNEFAVDAAYSLRLTETFAGAIGLKFIYSNLTGGLSNSGGESRAGIAVAGDLAFYYHQPIELKNNNDAIISWGINFSNLGTKINYGTYATAFIPSNLRTGVGFKYFIDEFNSIELGLDFNKLMVPTPATYNDEEEIVNGTNPDVGVTEGILRSFVDGQSFMEELYETTLGTGLEYTYNNTFFLRGGLFYESPHKGGRRYITMGLGFKFSVFNIDFSYLAPIYSHSPLAGTMRFSLNFYFK
jgi:hypothetical protein